MATTWDGWNLDVPARELKRGDDPVHLEPQVFDVLAYLVANAERVVPKEELLDEIWGDQFVSESALTSRIKSVRKALGDDGKTQRYVRNVHGRGYQFVGKLDDADHSSTAHPESADPALSIGVDSAFPFVGRRAELSTIEQAIATAGHGFIFIGGPPGVGKSRLAVEAMRRASDSGDVVVAARCEEHFGGQLQPIRDAVSQLAALRPDRLRIWAQGIEGQLVSMVPNLVRHLETPAVAVDSYAALDILMIFFDRVSMWKPLTMLVDDVHWSDQSTKVFLSRMSRSLRDRPIKVVGTFRNTVGDISAETSMWITQHAHIPSSTQIDLGAFDESSSQALAEAVIGEERSQTIKDLVRQTAGHGLLLTESLRDVQLGSPAASSIPHIVAARVDRLPPECQRLVEAGAVIGSEFAFDIATKAADLNRIEASKAIDIAIKADLLHRTASPSRFRFSHQMIPNVIVANLSPLVLAGIHQRSADALSAIGAPEAQIAMHTVSAVPLVPLSEALGKSLDVAQRSVEANDFDAAISLLSASLAVVDDPRKRAEILLMLGSAENGAGWATQAAKRFEEAAGLARDHGWVEILVEAAMGHYGRSPYRNTRSSSTLQLLEEASLAVGESQGLPAARLLAKTAAFSKFRLSLDACEEMTRRALDMAGDGSPHEMMELLELRSVALTCPAGVALLEPVDAELDSLRHELGVYAADAGVPENRLMWLAMGDALRAVTVPDAVRIKAQPIAEWRDLTLRSTFSAWDGDLDEAYQLCEDAASCGEQFWGESSHYVHAFGHMFLGMVGGNWDRALELLRGLSKIDENQHLTIALAWAEMAGGDRKQGRKVASRIDLELMSRHAQHLLGGNTLIAAAEVALLLEDERIASAAESALVPHQDLMLGVPWASSLAAADSLSSLASFRGDTRAATNFEAKAKLVYTSLRAPTLQARIP